MKKLILICLMVFGMMTQAQQKTQEQQATKKIECTNPTGQKVTKGGKDYPVCKGPKGGLYIIRISGKTGKPYKQYLKLD